VSEEDGGATGSDATPPEAGSPHLSEYVVCGCCGTPATGGPILVIGGLAICRGCVSMAADLYAGRPISRPIPDRPGWLGGWPDPEGLAAADPAALQAELDLLDQIGAPAARFRTGAEAALGGADAERVAAALGFPPRHRHRDPVTFGEGLTVIAVSWGADPYNREEAPDFGLYLDARWAPPWPHDHVDWPDFSVPPDPSAAAAALTALLDRARTGQRVEIGCLGGHGRTGTALAWLAVLSGRSPSEAVEWVRANYCEQAVETDDQASFIAALHP
jgi:hypothetical protein